VRLRTTHLGVCGTHLRASYLGWLPAPVRPRTGGTGAVHPGTPFSGGFVPPCSDRFSKCGWRHSRATTWQRLCDWRRARCRTCPSPASSRRSSSGQRRRSNGWPLPKRAVL